MPRIAFIWPQGLEPAYSLPLPFAALKASLDPSCECRMFDLAIGMPSPEKLEAELAAFRPDIVGITSYAMNFGHAVSAAAAAKRAVSQAVVVMGGPHASAWPLGVLRHREFDFVIRGEGELAFAAFVREASSASPRFENVPGLVRRTEGGITDVTAAIVENLDALPLPDYRFIRMDEYLRRGYRLFCDDAANVPIQTTRGCPQRCAFCGVAPVNGHVLRRFSIPYVMRWMQTLHRDFGARWFNIIEDNFTHDTAHAAAFCEAALKLDIKGLRLGTPNGIRMQRGDASLWRLMKRAGWEHVVVAPESGSAKVLRLMDKDLSPEEVEPIVRDIKAAGLRVRGFFIFGYPGETREDLDKTLSLMKRCDFDYVELMFFQPIPGTPAFNRLLAAGELDVDFLPFSFSFGERSYVSPDLKDVNFSTLFLRVKLGEAMRHPGNFLRLVRHTNPLATARKLLRLAASAMRR